MEFRDAATLILGAANVFVGIALFWATWKYAKSARAQADSAQLQTPVLRDQLDVLRDQAAASREQAAASERQALAAQGQVLAIEQQVKVMHPRPYVYLRLEWRWDTLILENSGSRTAQNIRVQVHQDAHDFLASFGPVISPAAGLPPGSQIRQSMGNRLARYDASRDDILDFTVAYADAAGSEYSERARLSLAEMFDFLGGRPPAGLSQEQMDAGRRHQELLQALGAISIALDRRISAQPPH